MPRFLYSVILYLIQPLVWLRLLWRARRQPEYLQHLGERYGYCNVKVRGRLIWLHAVSVGETRAAEPLLKGLLETYPHYSLLLTHMTPTGRAAGAELIAKYGPRLTQVYLPYDLPGACRRFLDHFKPRIGLLMETELWPNLIAAARLRSMPVLLINARLSERSRQGYSRFLPLFRPVFDSLYAIAAQTESDAQRLIAIGAQRVSVFGNLKFDVEPSADKRKVGAEWRQALGTRRIWLAASTRAGEEALILDAYAGLDLPELLLLLVPRHPQRFDEVAKLIEQRGLSYCRRSTGLLPAAETRVWLGDSMGEMPAYFTAADLALVGGTLLPFGGQNLIEAASCGCPVLVGPHTFNFAQATDDAISSGAAKRIDDAPSMAGVVGELLRSRETLQSMRQAATTFSHMHRGATARTISLIGKITALQRAD